MFETTFRNVAKIPAMMLVAASAVLWSGSQPAWAEDEATMQADCQVRAARTFRVGVGTVQTSYQGQRTDGTHAVNGSATVRGVDRTFQCSFDRSARRIVRFVANPAPKTAAAPAPATSQGRPSAGAPAWRDLNGARGSSGEAELQRRGFEVSRTQGLTTFWNHIPSGTCLRVVTRQGRYAVSQVPFAANCPL